MSTVEKERNYFVVNETKYARTYIESRNEIITKDSTVT